MASKRVRPFSNGTEWMNWESDNCERCQRVACPLRRALRRGYMGDGTVPEDVARRTNRHEFRVDDDNRFCTEIEFSEADKVRHANWLAQPKFSLVRDDGFVLAAGRWSVTRRQELLRNWNRTFASTGATVRITPTTETPNVQ